MSLKNIFILVGLFGILCFTGCETKYNCIENITYLLKLIGNDLNGRDFRQFLLNNEFKIEYPTEFKPERPGDMEKFARDVDSYRDKHGYFPSYGPKDSNLEGFLGIIIISLFLMWITHAIKYSCPYCRHFLGKEYASTDRGVFECPHCKNKIFFTDHRNKVNNEKTDSSEDFIMQCPECGKIWDKNANFCADDGTRLIVKA